jgi:acyl-CoA synthetase (AMP-forming)/AMP-acid ligase II
MHDREVGEIELRGPSISPGYYGNGHASTESRRDDWFRTGDLGYVVDGELVVCGRLKDVIIVRGVNFYPQDIEESAERSHPDLRPGCVAAFSYDDGALERLVVVGEQRAPAKAAPGKVSAAVRRGLAGQLGIKPHEVVLVRQGSILKTSSGKLRRRAIRAAYLAGELEVVGEAPPEVLLSRS